MSIFSGMEGDSPVRKPRMSRAAGVKRVGKQGALTKAQVVKVLDKYFILETQPESSLQLLATLVGSKSVDAASLTAHILANTSHSSSTSTVALLNVMVSAREREGEMGVLKMLFGVERIDMLRLWALMSTLGLVTGAMSSKPGDAATEVMQAVMSLTDAQMSSISAVTELVKG